MDDNHLTFSIQHLKLLVGRHDYYDLKYLDQAARIFLDWNIIKLICNPVSINLIANTTIRKIISSILICLFALCTTPKILIHDLLAKHRDYSTWSNDVEGPQINKAGYNCHFENFVAESPFINGCTSIEHICPFHFSKLEANLANSFLSQHHFFSELRGPPNQA